MELRANRGEVSGPRLLLLGQVGLFGVMSFALGSVGKRPGIALSDRAEQIDQN